MEYDLDGIFFGDDWGQQHGLIMGIDHWRHYIKPQFFPYATPEEVKEGLVRTYDIMCKNGGYIMAPSHGVTYDIPPENVMAMLEVLQNQDKYFFNK